MTQSTIDMASARITLRQWWKERADAVDLPKKGKRRDDAFIHWLVGIASGYALARGEETLKGETPFAMLLFLASVRGEAALDDA